MCLCVGVLVCLSVCVCVSVWFCLSVSLDVSTDSSQSSFVRRPSRRRKRRLSACSDSQCDSTYACVMLNTFLLSSSYAWIISINQSISMNLLWPPTSKALRHQSAVCFYYRHVATASVTVRMLASCCIQSYWAVLSVNYLQSASVRIHSVVCLLLPVTGCEDVLLIVVFNCVIN